MNGPIAFCPRCKREVTFLKTGNLCRCSVCGFQFEQSEPLPVQSNRMEDVVMTVGHVILRVVLIIGVVFIVGMAVLFASCAMHF